MDFLKGHDKTNDWRFLCAEIICFCKLSFTTLLEVTSWITACLVHLKQQGSGLKAH